MFEDNNNSIFHIFISGTTDNSLFTNYSYIQRSAPNQFEIKAEIGEAIMLEEDLSDDEDQSQMGAPSITQSKTDSLGSRSARNVLGYSPIDLEVLKKSADNARRWLNFHVLPQGLNNFPKDVIENNG